MGASVDDLLKQPEKASIVSKFVDLLRLGGFPTPSWHRFSILRHIVETEPELLVDLWDAIRSITKGGYARTARGVWLDLHGQDNFDELRKGAVFTEGDVVFTDGAGVGPQTLPLGAVWISNADKTKRYVLADDADVIVPLNGSVTARMRAEFAGAGYNLGNSTINELLTSYPGITVTNPAGDDGTWITQQGADAERDEEYFPRMIAKWGTLGSGSNDSSYKFWALSTSAEVRRAKVSSPYGGAVRICIAGDNGPVSSAALALVSEYIEAKRPIGVPDVVTANATVAEIAISGTIYLKTGRDGAVALSKGQSAVSEYARTLEIGDAVSRERLIAALCTEEVRDMELSSPAADVTLLATDVFVPTFSLVAV